MKTNHFSLFCAIFSIISALTGYLSLIIGIIFYDPLGGIIASGVFVLVALKWMDISIKYGKKFNEK